MIKPISYISVIKISVAALALTLALTTTYKLAFAAELPKKEPSKIEVDTAKCHYYGNNASL